MFSHSSFEAKGSDDWKIFHAADKWVAAAEANVRINKIRSLKSYEEYVKFLEDEKLSKQKCSKINLPGISDESARNRRSFTQEEQEDSDPQSLNFSDPEQFVEKDENGNENDSSDYKTPSSTHVSSQSSCCDNAENDLWESLSESEENQNIDECLKSVASSSDVVDDKEDKPELVNTNARKRNIAKDLRSLPYTSLRDAMIVDFLNSDLLKEDDYTSNAEAIKVNKYLDENLPLIQVIDVMKDIDKVLKVGKLTPKMERIMEYKQEHPFAFGYEEDELGCCPWIWFKLEEMFNKFWDSQWPN